MTQDKAQAQRTLPAALIIGAILLVIGIVGVAMQFAEGLVVSDMYPFGLYLAAFFCLVGGACSLLIIAAAAETGILPEFGPTRLLYAGALAMLVAAGCTITFMDCGQPLRVFSMIIGTNPTSMVAWDFYFLMLTTVVCLVGIFKPCKATAFIGSILALGIVVVEAMILIVTSGTPHWNNPMLVLLFLADAITIGAALALIAGRSSMPRMRFALATALALTLIMLLSDIASGIYTGDAAMGTLLSGPFAIPFWLMLIAGVALPIVLLAVPATSAKLANVSAALALCGVFVDKLTLLLAGQAITATGEVAVYAPGLVEVMGVAGAFGLALVLYELLRRAFDSRKAKVPQASQAKASA